MTFIIHSLNNIIEYTFIKQLIVLINHLQKLITKTKAQPLLATESYNSHNGLKALFIANVHVTSRSLYAVARSSSVTFVCPTQLVEIFGNVSTPFDTLTIR